MDFIYVVSTQSKVDYGFSVEDILHGAFRNLDSSASFSRCCVKTAGQSSRPHIVRT